MKKSRKPVKKKYLKLVAVDLGYRPDETTKWRYERAWLPWPLEVGPGSNANEIFKSMVRAHFHPQEGDRWFLATAVLRDSHGNLIYRTFVPRSELPSRSTL